MNLHPLTSDTAVRTAVLSASSQTCILFLIPWWLQNLFTLYKLQPFRFGYGLLTSTTRSSYVCFCWVRKQRTKSSSRTPSNAAITVWYSRQNTDITGFQAFGSEKEEMPHVQKRKVKNEIQIRFSEQMREQEMKNERQIRFSKWWENEKQKTKVKSSFQSKAKTEYEDRNSNPLFKVRRKTKNKIEIRFSVSHVDKKQKIEMEMEFHFTRPKKNEK